MDLSTVRGRSMAGAHLSQATLSGFDLRGTDLSGADLRGADLSLIRSGMTAGWTALVVGASLVLSVGLGVVVGVSARYLRGMYESADVRPRFMALFVTAALFVFIAAGLWRGLRYASRNVLPVTAALAISVGLLAIVTGAGTGIAAFEALVFVVVAVVIVVLAVLVRAVGGTGGRALFSLVAIAGGLAGGAAGGGVGAAIVAVSAMLMARRDPAPLLARTTAAVAARHGTSFRDANLAGANMSGAKLIACDFRGANLDGAHFDRSKATLCRFDKEAS